MNIKIVLYNPEILTNLNEIMHICQCFDVKLFVITDKFINYKDNFVIISSFKQFLIMFREYRKILFTVHTNTIANKFLFRENDVLFFGRESDGIELNNTQYFQQLLKINMPYNFKNLSLPLSVGITLNYCDVIFKM